MGYKSAKSQSSIELLITLSFGLLILLPIITFAFLQISTSNSTLSTTAAQQVANKISSTSSIVGSQGPPARQIISIQIPPNVNAIYIGNINNGIGKEIIFNISTNAGPSFVIAYTLLNVSGNLTSEAAESTYLINVSAMANCPTNPSVPCVYISRYR